MEIATLILLYAMGLLVPLNILTLMAIRKERKELRVTLRGIWRLLSRRK